MATEPTFDLWGPALFAAQTSSPERPWVLHAIGGDGSMTGWRMSSPALSIKFGHSWCDLRITDEGHLEIDTSGNQTWLSIDTGERLAMITAIRTRSRVYKFRGGFRHIRTFTRCVPYSPDQIVAIGGKPPAQEMERQGMSIPVDEPRLPPRWPERNQPPAQGREDPFPTFTEWSGDADTHLAQQLADLAAEHLPDVVDELPKDEEKP